MTFGEKLQACCKARGLSQAELAKQLMISRQAISKWELDQAQLDLNNLVQLSKILQVTSDYLINEHIKEPTDQVIGTAGPTKAARKRRYFWPMVILFSILAFLMIGYRYHFLAVAIDVVIIGIQILIVSRIIVYFRKCRQSKR